MSTTLTIALILLAIDSVLVIYAVAKQKWLMLAICVVIGGLLDVWIFKFEAPLAKTETSEIALPQ